MMVNSWWLDFIGGYPDLVRDYWYLIVMPFLWMLYWEQRQKRFDQQVLVIALSGLISSPIAFLLFTGSFPPAWIWQVAGGALLLAIVGLFMRAGRPWYALLTVSPWGIWLGRAYWPPSIDLTSSESMLFGFLLFLGVFLGLLLFLFGIFTYHLQSHATLQKQHTTAQTQGRWSLGAGLGGSSALAVAILGIMLHIVSRQQLPFAWTDALVVSSLLLIIGALAVWLTGHPRMLRAYSTTGARIALGIACLAILIMADPQIGNVSSGSQNNGPSVEEALGNGVLALYDSAHGAFRDLNDPQPSLLSTYHALEILNTTHQSHRLSHEQQWALRQYILDARLWDYPSAPVNLTADEADHLANDTSSTLPRVPQKIRQNWWGSPELSVIALRCLDLLNAPPTLIEELAADVEDRIVHAIRSNELPFSVSDPKFENVLAAAQASAWGFFPLLGEDSLLQIKKNGADHLKVKDRMRIEFDRTPWLDQTLDVEFSPPQELFFAYNATLEGRLIELPALKDLLPNWERFPEAVFSLMPPSITLTVQWDSATFPNYEPADSPVWGENGSLVHPDWLEYGDVRLYIASENYIQESLIDVGAILGNVDHEYYDVINETLALNGSVEGARLTPDGQLVPNVRLDNLTCIEDYAVVLEDRALPATTNGYSITLTEIPRGPIRVFAYFSQITHETVTGENASWVVEQALVPFEQPVNLTISIPAYGLLPLRTALEKQYISLNLEETNIQYATLKTFRQHINHSQDWRGITADKYSRKNATSSVSTITSPVDYAGGTIYRGVGLLQTAHMVGEECYTLMELGPNTTEDASVSIIVERSLRYDHGDLFDGLNLLDRVLNQTLMDLADIWKEVIVASQLVDDITILAKFIDPLQIGEDAFAGFNSSSGLFGLHDHLSITRQALEILEQFSLLSSFSPYKTRTLTTLMNESNCLLLRDDGKTITAYFQEEGVGSLAATHDAVKILELINVVPNNLQNKCNAYLGAFLVYQLTKEQLAEERKEGAQDDFLVEIKKSDSQQKQALESLEKETAWVEGATLEDGDREQLLQNLPEEPSLSEFEGLIEIDQFTDYEWPWGQIVTQPSSFLWLIIPLWILFSACFFTDRFMLICTLPGLLIVQNLATSVAVGEQIEPLARANRFRSYIATSLVESVHFMSTTLNLASREYPDALFYIPAAIFPSMTTHATLAIVEDRPNYTFNDYIEDVEANYSKQTLQRDVLNAQGGTKVPEDGSLPEKNVLLQEKYRLLFDDYKKTFPEEDEVTKMETSVLGASSLDNLKAGRWGDMTRYLAKKGVADLSMAKRTAHTIQVVDIETLMRQFDTAIQRLDELVKTAPNGNRQTIKKLANEIEQLKKDLRNDLYSSVERLQKESSYLSLTKIHPMVGGPKSWIGKITIPALCGVLANMIEAAPRTARVKRAFLMEVLLESLSFLDEIGEITQAGLNLREILRLAIAAEGAGDLSRGLRSLASKLILHTPGTSVGSKAAERLAESHLYFVDLDTARWATATSKVDWTKVDFSAQQWQRIAASNLADPIMEAIRELLGIKTVLEESGIEGGRQLKRTGETILGFDEINEILKTTGSVTGGGSARSKALKALEASLWNSIYTWYKGISTDPSSSIKGLHVIGDGGGNLRIIEHTFLDGGILKSVKEGKLYAKYLLQEKGHALTRDFLILGSPKADYYRTNVDWRKLWTDYTIRNRSEGKALMYRAERFYAFTRAFSEFWESGIRKSSVMERLRFRIKDGYQSIDYLPLKGTNSVFPTQEAMRQILDGLGFVKAKVSKRPPTQVYRVAEIEIIENAAYDGRIAFRIHGRDFSLDLSEVQGFVKQYRDKYGKTWASHFKDHLESVVQQRPIDSESSRIVGMILDKMKYWINEMGLHDTPLDDEDFYIFFADIAMRYGLSGNVSSSDRIAFSLAKIFDDPKWARVDHLTITNLAAGSLRAALDHLEIYYNLRNNKIAIVAIQDKVAEAGIYFKTDQVAKDLHVLKNFIEGLFNQIQSSRTGDRYGGERGILWNLDSKNREKMLDLIDTIRYGDYEVDIFGVQRMTWVGIENINESPKYMFDISINAIQPDYFGTYKIIEILKDSPAGADYREFGDVLEEMLDMMRQINPDKAKFFESRMLWGINEESLSRQEIDEIYKLMKKNVGELIANETGQVDFLYTKDMLEELGYKELGELYGTLELLHEARFNIGFASPTLKFWYNKAVDAANLNDSSYSIDAVPRSRASVIALSNNPSITNRDYLNFIAFSPEDPAAPGVGPLSTVRAASRPIGGAPAWGGYAYTANGGTYALLESALTRGQPGEQIGLDVFTGTQSHINLAETPAISWHWANTPAAGRNVEYNYSNNWNHGEVGLFVVKNADPGTGVGDAQKWFVFCAAPTETVALSPISDGNRHVTWLDPIIFKREYWPSNETQESFSLANYVHGYDAGYVQQHANLYDMAISDPDLAASPNDRLEVHKIYFGMPDYSADGGTGNPSLGWNYGNNDEREGIHLTDLRFSRPLNDFEPGWGAAKVHTLVQWGTKSDADAMIAARDLIYGEQGNDWFDYARAADVHYEYRYFMLQGVYLTIDENGDIVGMNSITRFAEETTRDRNVPLYASIPDLNNSLTVPVYIYLDSVYQNGWDWQLWADFAWGLENALGTTAQTVDAFELAEVMQQAKKDQNASNKAIVIIPGALPETIYGFDNAETETIDLAEAQEIAQDTSLIESFIEQGGTVLLVGDKSDLDHVCVMDDVTGDDIINLKPIIVDYSDSSAGTLLELGQPGAISNNGFLLADVDVDYFAQNHQWITPEHVVGNSIYPSTVSGYYTFGIDTTQSPPLDIVASLTSDSITDLFARIPEKDAYGKETGRSGLIGTYNVGRPEIAPEAGIWWSNLQDAIDDVATIVSGVPELATPIVWTPDAYNMTPMTSGSYQTTLVQDSFVKDLAAGWKHGAPKDQLSLATLYGQHVAKTNYEDATFNLTGDLLVFDYPAISYDLYVEDQRPLATTRAGSIPEDFDRYSTSWNTEDNFSGSSMLNETSNRVFDADVSQTGALRLEIPSTVLETGIWGVEDTLVAQAYWEVKI